MVDSTDDLCREISRRSGGVILLAFSRGKDSIAAWLQLRKHFTKIIPFHFASVPGLRFVNNSLDYYERIFQTAIERLVSPAMVGAIRKLIYQPIEDEDRIDAMGLPEFDEHACADFIRGKHRAFNAWCAFGIGLNDSIARRGWMMSMKGKNERWRSLYPCWDWNQAQILQTINEAGIKLPEDYSLANRSLSGIPTERHLERIEKEMPEEFRTIEWWYPLIRARLARNEFRKMRLAASKGSACQHTQKARQAAGG